MEKCDLEVIFAEFHQELEFDEIFGMIFAGMSNPSRHLTYKLKFIEKNIYGEMKNFMQNRRTDGLSGHKTAFTYRKMH